MLSPDHAEPPPPEPGRLSDDIARVLEAFAHREVTLGEIIALMRQRGFSFLLLVISLPFCTPVPLPGLSTPFGIIIAIVGLRIACGLSPWLPRRLMAVRLPARWLPGLFRAAQRPVRFIERHLRPNFTFLVQTPALRQLHGVLIMLCGLLLLLPLPIPFTNLFPALAVALLACALLERDGRFSIAGAAFFGVAVAYFALLTFGGAAAARQLLGAAG